MKFTPPQGTVSLIAEARPRFGDHCPMRFTVKDTGIGMDKEFLPHIFEPFSQEHTGTTSKYGGTGLGMSITKSLVDMMNGDISVESEKGKGTTFIIDLTLEAAPKDASVSEESVSPQDSIVTEAEVKAPVVELDDIDLAGRRLLVAEDQDLNAEILIDLLELEEIECDWAKNGRLAADMFAKSPEGLYSAILMDMRMPVLDGIDATREIRAMNHPDAKTIPIIALTANAFNEDVQRCLQAGMNAHMSKPVDADKLMDLLKKQIAVSEELK